MKHLRPRLRPVERAIFFFGILFIVLLCVVGGFGG